MEKNVSFYDEEKFGVFCRRVLINENIDIFREEKKISEYESYFCDLGDSVTKNFQTKDEYTFLNNGVQVQNFIFYIENEELFQAINRLKEKNKLVIMFSFWMGMKDVEIGQVLNMPLSTVNDMKHSTIKKLYTWMKGARK